MCYITSLIFRDLRNGVDTVTFEQNKWKTLRYHRVFLLFILPPSVIYQNTVWMLLVSINGKKNFLSLNNKFAHNENTCSSFRVVFHSSYTEHHHGCLIKLLFCMWMNERQNDLKSNWSHDTVRIYSCRGGWGKILRNDGLRVCSITRGFPTLSKPAFTTDVCCCCCCCCCFFKRACCSSWSCCFDKASLSSRLTILVPTLT